MEGLQNFFRTVASEAKSNYSSPSFSDSPYKFSSGGGGGGGGGLSAALSSPDQSRILVSRAPRYLLFCHSLSNFLYEICCW